MDDPFGPTAGPSDQQLQQQQQQQQPVFTLLTTPPIPWPQPALAAESVLQLGGRYWPSPKPPSAIAAAAVVLELADELDRAQHAASSARDDYLQALYLPEAAFPVADLARTLGRHGALLPRSLILPVAEVTTKHRRVLPYMLTTMMSVRPPAIVHERGSPIDEIEWRAVRAGFGVLLGASGLGVGAKAVEGELEEARNARRTAEEDRWLAAGKSWVEGLERRECVSVSARTPRPALTLALLGPSHRVLMQILLHFLLPPPPTALSAAALPKKRERKAARAASPSEGEPAPIDLAQSLMVYADRLSIWQALSTLGVDFLSLSGDGSGGGGKDKNHAGPSSSAAGAAASKPKTNWVAAFYIDVVEPNFGLSHPGFCHIIASTLQIPAVKPRPIKATPSRPEAESQRPQPTPPTPVVWPPPGSTGASGAPSGSSRRKGKAKQLPDDANRYVQAAADAVGNNGGLGSRPAGSINRTSSTKDAGAGSRGALTRSTSTSATTANPRPGLLGPGRKSSSSTTTAATILERAASLGPPAGLKSNRANSLGPSSAAATGSGNAAGSTSSRSNSFARAGSYGPGAESQTEKLMRRSVSFTKGAGVGRKSAGGSAGSTVGEATTGGGAKGEQTKLDGLWGARVSRVGGATAADEKGSLFGKAAGRRESLQRPKSFGSSPFRC